MPTDDNGPRELKVHTLKLDADETFSRRHFSRQDKGEFDAGLRLLQSTKISVRCGCVAVPVN